MVFRGNPACGCPIVCCAGSIACKNLFVALLWLLCLSGSSRMRMPGIVSHQQSCAQPGCRHCCPSTLLPVFSSRTLLASVSVVGGAAGVPVVRLLRTRNRTGTVEHSPESRCAWSLRACSMSYTGSGADCLAGMGARSGADGATYGPQPGLCALYVFALSKDADFCTRFQCLRCSRLRCLRLLTKWQVFRVPVAGCWLLAARSCCLMEVGMLVAGVCVCWSRNFVKCLC